MNRYLGGLQGAGHQRGHAADITQDSLAADVGPPGQVSEDTGDHLVELLAVGGQLSHQSLKAASLGAQSGLKTTQSVANETPFRAHLELRVTLAAVLTLLTTSP